MMNSFSGFSTKKFFCVFKLHESMRNSTNHSNCFDCLKEGFFVQWQKVAFITGPTYFNPTITAIFCHSNPLHIKMVNLTHVIIGDSYLHSMLYLNADWTQP